MKYLQRYCSLFCCLVLFFGCFSLTANAEEEVRPIISQSFFLNSAGSYILKALSTSYSENGTIERGTSESDLYYQNSDFFTAYSNIEVSNSNGNSLFFGGNEVTVRLENAYATFLLQKPSNKSTAKYFYHNDDSTSIVGRVFYLDGSYEDITATNGKGEVAYIYNNPGRYDLSLKFTPKDDVLSIRYTLVTKVNADDMKPYSDLLQSGVYHTYGTINCGEDNDHGYTFSYEQDTKETALLSGLLEWVKSIWNSVTETASNVKNGFTNVINSISNGLSSVVDTLIDLPAKIWGFISDGLKELFVPDEEYLDTMSIRFDEFLEEKFGALYQVAQIIIDFWEGIENADNTDTITIPETTINLPDDNQFSFGGYEVKIVPEGFGVLVTAVKSAVGIVCTVLFVNGLRKRYDEVMGVEQ